MVPALYRLRRQAGAPMAWTGARCAAIRCLTSDGYVHRLWETLALKRRPPTDYAAKFSVPFGCRARVVCASGMPTFRISRPNDSPIPTTSARRRPHVGLHEIDPADPYSARFTGHVEVQLADGSRR